LERLLAVVGPTATGKTSLAIEMAERLGGEVLSCDSMQVYRGMDIGTAKASPAEQARVKHHLIDIVDPREDFSVARYQQLAQATISDLNQKDILPILVGGTGLYYQAVVDNYQFYPMAKRQAIRDYWNKMISIYGLDFGFKHLKAVDPDYAALIGERDQKRVVRALEVYELTGLPFSRFQVRNRHHYELVAIGLNMERQELYERIERRIDAMIDGGLIEEVMRLREEGCNLSHTSMQALGYKQVMYFLQGFLTKAMMIKEMKRETRRFAKRQLTWFKKDHRIIWVSPDECKDAHTMAKNISAAMAGHKWGL
jgi:tRNA dimethylallyltransferase